MSLFSRGPRSLHERHAAAHAIGQGGNAGRVPKLSQADDLVVSVLGNESVLVRRVLQFVGKIVEDAADVLESEKQAAAIRSLVS